MRLYQVSFACGLAVGYVFGAKAGRERYEQIVKNARAFAEHPVVRQTARNVQSAAAGAAKSATRMAAAKGRNGFVKMRQRRSETSAAPGGERATATAKTRQPKAGHGDHSPNYAPVSGDFGEFEVP